MISPKEIEEKIFKKSFRGYDSEEVDIFLDEIIMDLEMILKENAHLKESINSIHKNKEAKKESDESVTTTLESAKKLAQDMTDSAQRKADDIIKKAEETAEAILRDAKKSSEEIQQEGFKFQQRANDARGRYKEFLKKELEYLDNNNLDFLSEPVDDFVIEDVEIPVDAPVVEVDEAVPTEPVEKEVISITSFEELNDTKSDKEESSVAVDWVQEIFGMDKSKEENSEPLSTSSEIPVEEKKKTAFASKETIVVDSSKIEELLKRKNR